MGCSLVVCEDLDTCYLSGICKYRKPHKNMKDLWGCCGSLITIKDRKKFKQMRKMSRGKGNK